MELVGTVPSEVWAAIVAVIGTGAVAWGTHSLTVRAAEQSAQQQEKREAQRFREQRLWEARKETYSEVLRHCRSWELARWRIHDGYNGEESNPHQFDISKTNSEASAESLSAYQSMISAFDSGRVLASREFAERMDKLRADMVAIEWYDPPSHASDTYDIAVAAYSSLLTIAQAELAD